MSKVAEVKSPDALDSELATDSLKRMIYFTRREAEKDGRTFCAYLLDLAMSALDEDSEAINAALKAKLTPLGGKIAN
ncbi:hypothetical protein [Polymorphum gilvum]|uniref:Uncharacterized protein n=1 Tax=Polymorphum gilvum (strain LMG 25793 / CGMCC 1.9160 / SL003B-26A1) TaxID=991905 RepID=F2IXA0_POLGS|nr:hypothetical protein [Polymorphum gilvum]ADZ70418.1 hypothetical protein SL003B_1992 [Polymorphum gilvum SL003B-26A1]